MNYNSLHRFLYLLHGIHRIIFQLNGIESWAREFCRTGGLEYLFMALLELSIDNLKSSLGREVFWLLIVVLDKIASFGYALKDNIKDYESHKSRMTKRILTILNAHAEYPAIDKCAIIKRQIEIEEEGKLKSSIIVSAFSLLSEGKQPKDYFNDLVKYNEFNDLLLNFLVKSENSHLRAIFAKSIKVFEKKPKEELTPTHPSVHLILYMFQHMLKRTLENERTCNQFFKCLISLMSALTKEELLILDLEYKVVICEVIDYINQLTPDTFPDLSIGLMNLLNDFMKKFSVFKEFVGQERGMIREVLHNGLFNYPEDDNEYKSAFKVKFLSKLTREAAFELLLTLCSDCPRNISETIAYLLPAHTKNYWRTDEIINWKIPFNTIEEYDEKSKTGYTGLKNLGATCYMNSMMQQFFMIPSFRAEILSVVNPIQGNDINNSILYQTQYLFGELQEGVKKYSDTKAFFNAVKSNINTITNETVHMDADEFYNLYLDRLEQAIKGTKQANTIKRHFGGVFVSKIECRVCNSTSLKAEDFLTWNLEVAKKRLLQQCLDKCVQGELLRGANAYSCEKCNRKVAAIKRICGRNLPRHLFIVLKRFTYHLNTHHENKISDYCEFPMELDMGKYTEEGIAKREGQGNVGTHPKGNYKYKLAGVTIHIGTTRFGHYISCISDREKEGRWLQFNDTIVTEYDIANIEHDAFGNSVKDLNNNCKNAYILIYEKVADCELPEDNPIKVPVVPAPILERIKRESLRYLYNKFVFQNDIFKFFTLLGLHWNSGEVLTKRYLCKNNDYYLFGTDTETITKHGFRADKHLVKYEGVTKSILPDDVVKALTPNIGKFILTMFLTTVIRCRDDMQLPRFMDLSKIYLNKNSEVSNWLLQQFTNKKVFAEVLLGIFNMGRRRLVGGLIYCAMLSIYNRERALIASEDVKNSILINFIHNWFSFIPLNSQEACYFDQYFQILSRLLSIDSEIRDFLLKKGALGLLLRLWLGEPIQLDDYQYIENTEPELGIPYDDTPNIKKSKELPLGLMKKTGIAYEFLFEAISTLIRSVSFNEKSKESIYSKIGKTYVLQGYEQELLSNPEIIAKMICQSNKNLPIVALSKAFVHMSWENLPFKIAIIKGLGLAIKELHWNNVKKYLHFIKELINNKDSLHAETIAMTQKEIFAQVEKSVHYVCMCGIKLIIWQICSIPELKEWHKVNNAALEWICGWIQEYLKQSVENQRESINDKLKRFGYNSAEAKSAWDNMMQVFLGCIENYYLQVRIDPQEKVEEINTMYYEKFLVNDEVEVYNPLLSSWGVYRVDIVLDELLYLVPKAFSAEYSCWVEVESDHLARLGIHTTSTETKG